MNEKTYIVIVADHGWPNQRVELCAGVVKAHSDEDAIRAALKAANSEQPDRARVVAISHPLMSEDAFHGLREVTWAQPKGVVYSVEGSTWISEIPVAEWQA